MAVYTSGMEDTYEIPIADCVIDAVVIPKCNPAGAKVPNIIGRGSNRESLGWECKINGGETMRALKKQCKQNLKWEAYSPSSLGIG